MTAADPRPLPDRRGATATYWDAVQNGQLRFQRCSRCKCTFFPARVVCPQCGAEELEWFESVGKGTVYSDTVVRFHPNPAYSHLVPYVVALVDLEPGCETSTHRGIMGMPDLTVSGAVQSGREAFKMAGLKASDMDFAELYDAFTINTILFLEDLGFCTKGEGGAFVQGGRIAPGGELPVNTNGGGLSYCHPGMYGLFLAIEAVRQVRGEAGDRQLSKARVGVVHGNGGTLSAQCTAILGAGIL